MAVVQRVPVLHVRFEGKSFDIALVELGLTMRSSDAAIQRAVAAHLGIHESRLRYTMIDRHPTGNITLRPEAVFG